MLFICVELQLLFFRIFSNYFQLYYIYLIVTYVILMTTKHVLSLLFLIAPFLNIRMRTDKIQLYVTRIHIRIRL
jgi:hypothetical protein